MGRAKNIFVFTLMIIGLQSTVAAAGEVSVGLIGGFVNTDLKDLDSLIVSANGGGTGPITTKALGNGLEAALVLGYRWDGTVWAVHFQPSYYFNSTSGTDTAGDAFDYGVTAIVAMPLLRVYALENDFLSLYFQFGVGWAQVYGEANEGADQTEFSGSNLGYQGGLGLEMCYAKMHCLNLEGNLRSLDIERSIVDKTTSSGTHANGRITQSNRGSEIEVDNRDLGMDLTGFQFLAGYVFKF